VNDLYTGYIKIYNLNIFKWTSYTTNHVRTSKVTIHLSNNIKIHHRNPCEHPAAVTNERLLIIHSATTC